MAEHTQKDRAEEKDEPDIKRTREYRNFKKLLKRVIKAPPLRKGSKTNAEPA